MELREPAPAADAVETELRCVGGAFSTLGMLIMKGGTGYERYKVMTGEMEYPRT